MALRTAGGVLIFLGFDASVRWVIDTSGMSMLPSQICSALVGPNGSLIGTGVLVFFGSSASFINLEGYEIALAQKRGTNCPTKLAHCLDLKPSHVGENDFEPLPTSLFCWKNPQSGALLPGMLSAFGGLSVAHLISPTGTATAHQALLPAVAWVGRWLPVFLVPVQVMLPTIIFPGPVSSLRPVLPVRLYNIIYPLVI